MKLFEDFKRTNKDTKKFRQPIYDFYNNSALSTIDNIRNYLNNWYYYFNNDIDFQKRFKSKDDQEYKGAFFELFCHELLRKSGFKINIHSKVNNESKKLPDFEVLQDDKIKFYLECTLANSPVINKSTEKLQDEILEVIDKLVTPNYFFNIDFNKSGKESISKRSLKNYLYNKLNELPDNISFQDRSLFKWEYIEKNWGIIFSVTPKSEKLRVKGESRGLGTLSYGSAQFIDSTQPFLNALKSKRATRYGELNKPYIIAINSSDFIMEDIDIMKALFGNGYYSEKGFKLSKYSNDFISFFIHQREPQNKSVSAVLIAVDLSPVNMTPSKIELWHNPFARFPLNKNLIKLKQIIFDKENEEYSKKIIEGKPCYEIMDINENYNNGN